VVCEECGKAREIDGDIPDCETEKGCIIPPLSGRGARVMAIREKIIRLKELVDPGTILAMYGASLYDLEMLAKAEEMIEALRPKDMRVENG
jgi:hypothetical protein